MMVFNDPCFLFFLAAPAAWIALLLVAARMERSGRAVLPAVAFPAAAEARAAGTTWRLRTLWLPGALRIAGLCLVVLALARPVVVRARIPIPSQGIELAVVLDRSSSLSSVPPAQDTGRTPGVDSQPSVDTPRDENGARRAGGEDATFDAPKDTTFDILKRTASDFVRSRASDRIALVTFARTPETIYPFTGDEIALAAGIESVEIVPQDSEEDGTALGAALAEAARLFEDSRSPSRAAVLFTDGRENRFVIEPLTAARLCAELGVRIHTVALDLEAEPLDTSVHRRIAAITGGRAFTVARPGDLGEAMRLLDEMEKTPMEDRSFEVGEDVFKSFLLPAVLLLAASFLSARLVYGRVP